MSMSMSAKRALAPFLLLTALTASGCSKHVDDMESGVVDFSNPKRVLSSVFFAAKEGKSDHLSSLCDPAGNANTHAKRICAQELGAPDWSAFVSQFEKARLIGEARIAGNTALVNFVFGKSGTSPETMELVRRDGRWYLLAF